MESLRQVCCSFSRASALAPLVRCSPLFALVAVGALLLLPCLCSAALSVLISDLYCCYSAWLLCLCCLCLRSSPLILWPTLLLLICSWCLCSAPAVLLLAPCCCAFCFDFSALALMVLVFLLLLLFCSPAYCFRLLVRSAFLLLPCLCFAAAALLFDVL